MKKWDLEYAKMAKSHNMASFIFFLSALFSYFPKFLLSIDKRKGPNTTE